MLGDFASLLVRDRWFRVAMIAAVVNMTTSVNIALAVYDAYLSFSIYWIEIAVVSLAFGALTGVVALIISAGCVLFFFIPPAFSFRIVSSLDAQRFGEFVVLALLVWVAASLWHRLKRGSQAGPLTTPR
jgi:K+-sensing histidine kinase KdpD